MSDQNNDLPVYLFSDHPEHTSQIPNYRQKWIDRINRTTPQTEEDKQIVREAMRAMYLGMKQEKEYSSLELPPPSREIFASSPVIGGYIVTLGAVMWECKERNFCIDDVSFTLDDVLFVMTNVIYNRCLKFGIDKSVAREVMLGVCASADIDPKLLPRFSKKRNTLTKVQGEIEEMVKDAMSQYFRLYNGGNLWGGWCSYLSFFREIVNYPLSDLHEKYIHYERACIHGGPRYVHRNFWVVSDFPTRLCLNEEGQLHSANGPAMAWRDGFKLYYWRGIKVPGEWIESPSTIDPMVAINHPNAEQRRCAAEIIGWARIIEMLGASTVNKDEDPMIGELLEVSIENTREKFLKVVCGTGRTFAIPVPPEMTTALQAQAWIHQLDESVMRNLEART